MDSLWTPDAVNLIPGFTLTILADSLAGTVVLTYNGINAPFGGYAVTTGFQDASEITARLINYKLYGVNPGGVNYLWHVFVDSIEIWVNGSHSVTLNGFDQVSNALGPSWIPIFCGLIQMSGTVGVRGAGTASAIISDGYRWQKSGIWYSSPTQGPPVSVNPPTVDLTNVGPVNAPFGLSINDSVITSSTWGPQINIFGTSTAAPPFTTFVIDQTLSGVLIPIPNLPKSIVRMNGDYGATFWRYAVPLVQAAGYRQWYLNDVLSPSYETTAQAVVFNRGAPGSQEVGPSPGAIEGYFGLPTYSIATLQRTKQVKTGDLFNEFQEETLIVEFPGSMDTLQTAYVAPYMQHQDIRANYFNSAVCHPHWSIGYFTGPWNLYGGAQTWENYWGPIREQYLSAQQRRNHIVSCPLESSGWNAFLDAYFQSNQGYGMRWIGVCRWQTQSVSPLTSLTPDSTSSPAWTVESASCTLAFGSNVAITPLASVCTFHLDLLRWDVTPFFYAAISQSVLLNWPTTNITSVAVYAVSSDGSTIALFKVSPSDTTTTPNVTYNFPMVQDAKYAGSWGINNGAGVAIDTGVDVPSGGMSPAIMNDYRTQVGFAMLLGVQARYLRFVVTPADDTMPCAIDYPQFNAATAKTYVRENGQITDVLYSNGPGVRWTNHVWYDGMLFEPPLFTGLGYQPSVIDWLCDKRILLLGVTPTGGTPSLTTECTQLYDSFEGNSVGQVDDNSNVFLLPPDPSHQTEGAWKAALVNSWSEVPPLAAFPTFGRDPATWLPTQVPTQKTWSLAQLPRRIASPGSRTDLLNPGGTQVTTLSSVSAPGWFITEHQTPVTNSEAVNWQIVNGSTVFAHVTPWHGWFCEMEPAKSCLRPWHVQDKIGRVHLVCCDNSGNLIYRRANTWLPNPDWAIVSQITNGGAYLYARMTIDPTTQRIMMLATTTGFGVYPLYSDDDGVTFTLGSLLVSQAYAATPFKTDKGLLGYTWFQYITGTSGGGHQFGQTAVASGAPFSTTFEFKDSSGNPIEVADGGWANVEEGKSDQAPYTWSPVLFGQTMPTIMFSFDDCRTWAS